MSSKEILPLVYSPEAQMQIKCIHAYRSHHQSVKRADKIIKSIIEKGKLIPLHPYAYPKELRCDVPTEQIRRALVHKDYSIIFEIEKERISVLKVYHNAMNIWLSPKAD